MEKKSRKADSVYQEVEGYPDLEINTKTGVYYVRRRFGPRGQLFKSTRQKTKGKAQTEATRLIEEFTGQKPGLKNKRITIAKLCELTLKDLEEQTRTLDEEGHPLRRKSTFTKDLSYLRDSTIGIEKKRKNMRDEGVIRDLFGEEYADEIDEQYWKTWVKRKGSRLGRGLGDIAKYLSLVLSYAFDEKYIARKPELVLPERYRKTKKKAIVFSDDQILLFYSKAKPTLKDLIVIASENPLRPHENYEVHWSMVHIKMKGGKPVADSNGNFTVEYDLPSWFVKKNARKILLTPNAAKVIVRRWKENQALPPEKRSPFVFPAPSDRKRAIGRQRVHRMWRQMKKQCCISKDVKVNFGWFRHNVYRRLLKIHGVPLASVSQTGGTSMRTLQAHYDIEEEQARLQVASAINLDWSQSGKDEEE